MLLELIDNKIRRAFSDSAVQYEVLSGLQKEIGRELVKRIQDKEDCDCILDVGMGTGYLTDRLGFLFPGTKVVGMDFAGGMIQRARQKYGTFHIVQADAAALPFKPDTFDIVISNLVYQWVGDLKNVFKRNYASLKDNGIFCSTLFGRRTLEELFLSLENSLPRDGERKEQNVFPVKRLPRRSEVVAALKEAGFKKFETESEIIKTHFEDMLALVRWIRDIGANAIEKDIYIGKSRLLKANEYYKRHFKDRWGVCASFEVIWVKAEK